MSNASNGKNRDGRLRRLVSIGIGTAGSALYVLAVQILALITLEPAAYGTFSLQYLTYAFAASVTLSVVSEAWSRSAMLGTVRSSWAEYSGALLYLAIIAGLVTAVISIFVPALRPIALWGGLAVFASTYRSGARYYSLREGRAKYVVPADFTGLAVTIAAWSILMAADQRNLSSMVAAWALGALASVLTSQLPHIGPPKVLIDWIKSHNEEIRRLLRDSLLMDLGAIGTPYVLAPALGLSDFGTYRAISNVAAPVRLVLNPIRPLISGIPARSHGKVQAVGGIALTSLAFGGLAYAGLAVIRVLDIYLGALTEVASFALPVGLFVASNFFGHFYYVVARTHLSGRALLTGRVAQTVLAVAPPIVGALIFGLPGAIWFYALATLMSSIAWFGLVSANSRAS